MQEVDELKTLVVQSLESQGILNQLRAQIRANVYNIIDNKENNNSSPTKTQQLLKDPQSFMVLEMILEYLQFYKLEYSTSVLANEANCRDYSKRNDLAKKYQLNSNTQFPLINQIIQTNNNNNNNLNKLNNQNDQEQINKKKLEQDQKEKEREQKEKEKEQKENKEKEKQMEQYKAQQKQQEDFQKQQEIQKLKESHQQLKQQEQRKKEKQEQKKQQNQQEQQQTKNNSKKEEIQLQNQIDDDQFMISPTKNIQESLSQEIPDEQNNYGHSQGFDMSVDSEALEEYDYMEDCQKP